MRKLLVALLLLGTSASAFAGDTYVRGYTRKDGTYVAPHYRSAPAGNPYNNYSTKGNTNPYSGERGTVDPYHYNSGSSNGSNGLYWKESPSNPHGGSGDSPWGRRIKPQITPSGTARALGAGLALPVCDASYPSTAAMPISSRSADRKPGGVF